MNVVKPLTQTRDTITLKRADFDALVRSAEDAIDLAAVDAHRAYEDRVGWDSARRNYLTADEARRLLDGENPVRVWREKRGIQQRALAEAAEVAASYLAEIEGGKKPGSSGALQRIAGVLDVSLENLIGLPIATAAIRPVDRSNAAAERLAKLAEAGADRDRLADEARAIVAEWRGMADREGWSHQTRAMVQTLWFYLTDISTDWAHRSVELTRGGDVETGRRMRRASTALEAAIDALRHPNRKD